MAKVIITFEDREESVDIQLESADGSKIMLADMTEAQEMAVRTIDWVQNYCRFQGETETTVTTEKGTHKL